MMRPLGEVAEMIRGVTFKPDQLLTRGVPGAVACIRTKNVQSTLDLSDVIYVPAEVVKQDRQFTRSRDIIISSANSWNMVGKCVWVDAVSHPTTFGGFVSTLRVTSNDLDPRYLYWWFSSPRTQATVRGFGRQTTNISNLDVHRTLRLEVPLPPLPEQRRIAAILDQVDALRAKRRRQEQLCRALAERLFEFTFFDRSAPMRALSEVADIQGGLTVNRARADQSRQAPYLRVANVFRGSVDLSEVKTIGVTDAEVARNGLQRGDVLIVEGHGNEAEVGRAARWGGPDGFVHQNHLIRARPKVDAVTPEYLEAFLNSSRGRAYFRTVAKTTSGLNTINMTNVRALGLPVPSLSEQQQFGAALNDILNLRDRSRAHLAKLDELFASLQHRVFTGQL